MAFKTNVALQKKKLCPTRVTSCQAPVVQKLDSTIHQINHYPVDNAIGFPIIIHWIVIYPVDSAIQPLNNWGQVNSVPVLTIDLIREKNHSLVLLNEQMDV